MSDFLMFYIVPHLSASYLMHGQSYRITVGHHINCQADIDRQAEEVARFRGRKLTSARVSDSGSQAKVEVFHPFPSSFPSLHFTTRPFLYFLASLFLGILGRYSVKVLR